MTKPGTQWAGMYSFSCARLFDGSVTMRIDGEEVALLPPKKDCSVEVLERELTKLCMAVDEYWSDLNDPPEPKDMGDPNW